MAASELWAEGKVHGDRILSSPFVFALVTGSLQVDDDECRLRDFVTEQLAIQHLVLRASAAALARCKDGEDDAFAQLVAAASRALRTWKELASEAAATAPQQQQQESGLRVFLCDLSSNSAMPIEQLVAAVAAVLRLTCYLRQELCEAFGRPMQGHPCKLCVEAFMSEDAVHAAAAADAALEFMAVGLQAQQQQQQLRYVYLHTLKLFEDLVRDTLGGAESSREGGGSSRKGADDAAGLLSSFFDDVKPDKVASLLRRAGCEEDQVLQVVPRSPQRVPRVLIVAGSDSGGGAGIQADIKACEANGAFSMTAIAALTAQNTHGVKGVFPIGADFLTQQLEACLDDIGADVIKTGMIPSEEHMEAIARASEKYGVPLVVDPVMVASSGDLLIDAAAVRGLKRVLLSKALLATPNIPEAAVLLKGEDDLFHQPTGESSDDIFCNSAEQLQDIAKQLAIMFGPKFVLVKGGHMEESKTSVDALFDSETQRSELFVSLRVQTRNTHGTGCTLASSIAAGVARGFSVPVATRLAKEYLSRTLRRSQNLAIGSGGHGPMQHSPHVVWA